MSVFQVTDHTPSRDLRNKGIPSIPSFAFSLINLHPDSNRIASLFFPPSWFGFFWGFFGGKTYLDTAQTVCFSTLGLGIQLCQESSLSHRRNGIKPTKPLEFPYGCWDEAPLVSKENPLGGSGITGNSGKERGYFQAGTAGSAPSLPIARDVPVLEKPSTSQIPVFHLFPPWKPKAADQWDTFSQGVNPGWMGLGNGGSCPCPQQGVGMGSSLRSLPSQKILGIYKGKNSKLRKKSEAKTLYLERRQRKG